MHRFPRFTKPLLALGFALVLFIVVGLVVTLQTDKQSSSTMLLSRPPFLQAAQASTGGTDTFDIGEKLDAEAGMSAWFKNDGPIDLGLVKAALRTVEIETPTYIVGSVDVPNYPEVYDAHIYVHVDGWFLAYYLKADLPAKIVDVVGRTIQSSNLESALAVVSGVAGVPFSSGTHYDFRYADANKILLVAEDYLDGDSFNIVLPAEYGYFDRSFAIYDTYYLDVFLDGTELAYSYTNSDYDIAFGTISSSQLLTSIKHTFDVSESGSAYGVLMIIYRTP